MALDRVDAIRAALRHGTTTPQLFATVTREFAEHLEPHFRVEEGSLSSTFYAEIAEELRARIVREHAQLRTLAHGISERDADALRAYADLLEAHVLFEEQELYPAITACLQR